MGDAGRAVAARVLRDDLPRVIIGTTRHAGHAPALASLGVRALVADPLVPETIAPVDS